MQKIQATIRLGSSNDIPGICELEKRIWSNRGVVSVDQETLQGWATTHKEGLLVGEHQGQVRGYAYFEYLSYDPEKLDANWPPARGPFTLCHHNPRGSNMYGVSAAADLPGLGRELFSHGLRYGGQQKKKHLAILVRMQRLGRFLTELRQEHTEAKNYEDSELGLWYAIQCVEGAGGKVASRLQGKTPPRFFPKWACKDPVLTYPARVAPMTLRALVPSSFNDQESANLLALATFPTL